MFDRYNEKARRVIFFARYEASQLGTSYIETEHLLLGVLREDKALTSRMLPGKVKVESIRQQIEAATVKRGKVSTSVDMPVSNEVKRVLAYASEEAARLSHQHIGTEHLVLGLLREENSFAAKILNDRGVRLSAFREQLSGTVAEVTVEPRQAKEFVLLSDFSTYLTQQASDNRLLPLIGRQKELDEVIHILGRSRKNNVVLVGEAGVGKRAIVEGLAQRAENIPAFLVNKRFTAIDLSMIVTAAQHSSRSREFLGAIENELAGDARTIFFFDELHHLLAAGAAGGSSEITLLLKPALLSGKVRCIAAATQQEYREASKTARWLGQCFLPVQVAPATETETIAILHGIRKRFEIFHCVTYSDDALTAAVVYSSGHVKNRHLPDKAIDLIDDAGAYVKLTQHGVVSTESKSDLVGTVTAEHIVEALARWTGEPIESIRQAPASAANAAPKGKPGAAKTRKKKNKR
ncbi:MAG TPA: Clp protease N-terminal domain-containing protein [Candidatus Angelobacter sp.]|nr:Clp protease N-terminal domain-containing protein [Candidatus Angelobacter sp.]